MERGMQNIVLRLGLFWHLQVPRLDIRLLVGMMRQLVEIVLVVTVDLTMLLQTKHYMRIGIHVRIHMQRLLSQIILLYVAEHVILDMVIYHVMPQVVLVRKLYIRAQSHLKLLIQRWEHKISQMVAV